MFILTLKNEQLQYKVRLTPQWDYMPIYTTAYTHAFQKHNLTQNGLVSINVHM